MVREKALQTAHGFNATLWEQPYRDEIMKITGRSAWTSMYSFIRAACCPEDVWDVVVVVMEAWENFNLMGLKAPADKKVSKQRAVPMALAKLIKRKPKTKITINPKKFPQSTFEKMFTGIPMDATKALLEKLVRKEVGFSSIIEVCALFVLVLCCCMCTFIFLNCFCSSSTNRKTMQCSWTPCWQKYH
jgi:hypothetical protein